MTELQYLIWKLVENQYVYFTRCNSEETTLEDIFFAHPESIKLLNAFPTVLVMDSTYKTNNHRMPLFEIVGCTSTKMMYSVGFTFLHFEQEDNFTWALKMVKDLCFFHIGKNVRVKCITNCRVIPKPPKGAKVGKKQVKKARRRIEMLLRKS